MRNTILIGAVFLAGLLGGMLVMNMQLPDSPGNEPLHAAKHLVPGYVCPMHPSVVSSTPANCPICGMALEAKNLQDDMSEAEGIPVSPAMSSSLGVRIAHAETGRVSETVFASGFVETVTSAKTKNIDARVEGVLTKVYVEPGDWVAQGDILLEIDSAEYAAIQESYLDALAEGDYDVVTALRKQLVAMQARQAVLDGVDRNSGKPLPAVFQLEAPRSGIVKRVADQGDTIAHGQRLLRLSSPTVARAHLRSYARAARSVKPGRRAQLDLPQLPGLYWPGRVIEVNHDVGGFYSVIEADFEVPDEGVEKGVFVGAYVNAGTSEAVLRIPATAVIRAAGESRVVRLLRDGSFAPVKVETGYIGSEWAEIRSGLAEGDAVVERAQFLIDSEATMRAGLARMNDR